MSGPLEDAVVNAARTYRAERLDGRVDRERAARWYNSGLALDAALKDLDEAQQTLPLLSGSG